ncbi:hypothetical protein [Bacillus sp. OTU2372]|uniref:hypothetical protein n=1 Tax=Bacillus sp. OTU2372 TaxID=3043858 RepID=UPI00313B2BB2
MIEHLHTRVSNIKKADSDEKIRFELYSIVTAFLLSTEIFNRNSQIKDFLISSNQNFKNIRPYAYHSRAILLGQVLKIIKKETKLFNYNFALDIKNHLEEALNNVSLNENLLKSKSENNNLRDSDIDVEKDKLSVEKKHKNYTDSLFNRFKRGE